MTYGDLLTLIPHLVNRPAAALAQNVDMVRRAVKWAFSSALSRTDFECFSTFADVEISNESGLNWQEFTDINNDDHFLSRVSYVSVLNDDGTEYVPIDLITRRHVRYRDMLRRPFPREFSTSARPTRRPTAYIKASKIYLTWFGETTLPTNSTIRLDGIIALPNFLDTAALNPAQLEAREWMLTNAENYLIAKSIEFLQFYMKEDDRVAGVKGLAEETFREAVQLDSAIKDSNDDGYTLE